MVTTFAAPNDSPPGARDRALMEMHVEALYTHDASGSIVLVREPNGAPAPRFFLGRVNDGSCVRRYRNDVDDALRRALESASASGGMLDEPSLDAEHRAAADLARYAAVLDRFEAVRSKSAGPALCFPETPPLTYAAPDHAVVLVTEANVELLQPFLPAWTPDVQLSPPLLALVVDGAAVSVCGSVRITPRAHESGVDTAPAFRGRGYAPRVVAAWARAVYSLGAEPLYSTGWHNTASRAVARKLRLIQFGSDLHLT